MHDDLRPLSDVLIVCFLSERYDALNVMMQGIVDPVLSFLYLVNLLRTAPPVPGG